MTIVIVAVCVLAAVIIAGIVAVGTGMVSITTDSGNQGISPASTSVMVVNPVVKQTPVKGGELTQLQKEGISLIAGKWYGNDPITVKVGFFPISMPAEFNGDAKDDFTATFWGTVKDVPTMDEPILFNINVYWEYKGNNKFTGTTDDGSQLDFTCDGTFINIVFNPYQNGLTDNSMANIDIPIKLHKV
ncbi:MAG TPA: hypothetical protein O0X39_04285 [Methanocorpusculum sp.]|nr:hypothetical protein [Methanocorpusculum sp.]